MNPTKPSISSHSSQVRERRNQQSQVRVEKASTQARRPVRYNSVLTRNNNFGTPVAQRASSAPRRKIKLDLGSGAELQLPAMPVVNPGWRVVSGILVAFFAAMLMLMTNSSSFEVSAIDFQGLERMNPADIEAGLDLGGSSIFSVDPAEIQADLQKSFPELKNISVKVNLPAKITVAAVERQPVLTWAYGDQSLWVDKEGAIFPVRGEAGPTLAVQADEAPPLMAVFDQPVEEQPQNDVVSAEGETPKTSIYTRLMDLDVLQAAVKLSETLPPETKLAYSQNNGFGWDDSRGWKVYIGHSLENLDTKLVEYNTIVAHLAERNIQPKMISVEHLRAPFYRLED